MRSLKPHKTLNSSLSNKLERDMELKPIGYILVLIREDECNDIKDIIATVVDVAEAKAMVEAIIGPLIVILVGVPLPQQGADEIRRDIMECISQQVGSKVSIIHGATTCPVGIVGTEARKEYTAFIPGYSDILKCLVSMEPGKIEEWK
jgi:hypothetical protein